MRVVIALVIVIFLFSCHRIHDGKVIDKYIIPAHAYHWTSRVMVGKVPVTQFHTGWAEEKLVLHVQNKCDKEIITERFCVDHFTYCCTNVGDYFNDTIHCSMYDPK